jgi:anti-sigma factor RsiW
MTCREFINFLDKYVAGELPHEARTSFDGHLRCCVDCRNYLDSYQKAVHVGKRAFACGEDDEVLPGAVPESMIRAVLSATSRPHR